MVLSCGPMRSGSVGLGEGCDKERPNEESNHNAVMIVPFVRVREGK
jgi:hypothetical protein